MKALARVVMKLLLVLTVLLMMAGCDEASTNGSSSDVSDISGYAVVDTDQFACYDDEGEELERCPDEGEPFNGQDSQYDGNQPSYTDNGAGAVRFDTKVEGGPLGEGGERYYNYVRLVRDADL